MRIGERLAIQGGVQRYGADGVNDLEVACMDVDTSLLGKLPLCSRNGKSRFHGASTSGAH
tara:strand:- start:3361 stop:3540 length:180 start_codon:yes stop_codon:yes gene_type:complete